MPIPFAAAGAAGLVALGVNLLRTMLMVKAGVIIAKALMFLGLTIAVQKLAIEPLLEQVRGLISGGPSGSLGAIVLAWAGVLKLDTAVTMILSAYGTAAAIRSARVALGIAEGQ